MGLKEMIAQQIRRPSGILGTILAGTHLSHQHQHLETFCVELLQIDPQDVILEVGFGNGYMLNKIAPKLSDGRVYGIDHSQVMLRQASKRNKRYIQSGVMELQQGDLSQLPYPKNHFDKVVSNNTIYFWRNPLDEAKELLRVLKPGCLLLIGFRTKEQLSESGLAQVSEVFQHYDPDELEQLLQEAGFETLGLEHRQRINGSFDSFAFLARKPEIP